MLNTINFQITSDGLSVKNLSLVEQSERFCHCLAHLDEGQVWIKYFCSQDTFWYKRFLNEQSFFKDHACHLNDVINIPQYFKNKLGEYLILEHLKGVAISQTKFSKNFALEIDEIKKLKLLLNHLASYQPDGIDIVFDKGYLLAQVEKAKIARLVPPDTLEWIESQIKITKFPLAICHGDFLLRNIIACKGQFYLIDWEYFGLSVRYWDFATLWCQFIGKIDFQKSIFNLVPTEFIEEFRLTVMAILLKELRLDFNTREKENSEQLRLELNKLTESEFSVG